MNNEFKKINSDAETRYVLESASGGVTGVAAVGGGTVPSSMGGVQRRSKVGSILVQDTQTVTVPVKQKPRQGPLRQQTGAGAHRDKKKEQKAGQEKHKKPYFEDHEIRMAGSELQSIAKDATELLALVKRYSEEKGLDAWQQSKITKAADYLNAVLTSLSGDIRETQVQTIRRYYAGDPHAQDTTRLAQMRDYFAQQDPRLAQQAGAKQDWFAYGKPTGPIKNPIVRKVEVEDELSELKEPTGSMFLKFRIKRLPGDEQMIFGYGGFGTTPKDVTVSNAKIKPFSADEPEDVISKIRAILNDEQFIGVEKIILDIPDSLMSPLSYVLDYAERDERLEMYSGEEGEEPETTGGKSVGYMIDPETGKRKKIDRSKPQAQVGGSGRGVASTGMTSVQASSDGQRLIQGLLSQGRLSKDTKVQGNRITLRQDDYKKILDVLGNERFQTLFKKVGSIAEGIAQGVAETWGLPSKGQASFASTIDLNNPEGPVEVEVHYETEEEDGGMFNLSLTGVEDADTGADIPIDNLDNNDYNRLHDEAVDHEQKARQQANHTGNDYDESSDAYMSRLNSYLESTLAEKIPPNADVDYYIKDFAKSNAPSLRGKTKEKRRQMAIAAYYGNKQKKKK